VGDKATKRHLIWRRVFSAKRALTVNEVSEFTGIGREYCRKQLNYLVADGILSRKTWECNRYGVTISRYCAVKGQKVEPESRGAKPGCTMSKPKKMEEKPYGVPLLAQLWARPIIQIDMECEEDTIDSRVGEICPQEP
jgi:DNA-binding Lrp family transcriptional regulator